MESAGDAIRDISKIIQQFPFEYVEKEIGGFGSVHFYMSKKLRNVIAGYATRLKKQQIKNQLQK